MHSSFRSVSREVWNDDTSRRGSRVVPEETAVALTYNGGCYAVMMATPHDLLDFAIGFSLAEGIVDQASQISSIETVVLSDGIELRMWLEAPKAERLSRRRRHIAGPTGCGLCGIESIAEAVRPCAVVQNEICVTQAQIMAAVRGIAPLQTINKETRAVHAAAYWTEKRGIALLREDVGRHNALDKLAGAMKREGFPVSEGMVLLTSRISVEMVQKTAAIGTAVLTSISAPTAAAVRMAEAAGITLVAIARDDGFEVFTHPHRILQAARKGYCYG
jgi:FdhD protein